MLDEEIDKILLLIENEIKQRLKYACPNAICCPKFVPAPSLIQLKLNCFKQQTHPSSYVSRK